MSIADSARRAERAATKVSCRLTGLAGAHAVPARPYLRRDQAVRSVVPKQGPALLVSRMARQGLRQGLMTLRSPND
jgi:hypothetical protein